jgi:hypothetical protein
MAGDQERRRKINSRGLIGLANGSASFPARAVSAVVLEKIFRAPFRGLLFGALHGRYRMQNGSDLVRQLTEATICLQ